MWEYFLNIFDAHLPALWSRENIIFLLKIFDAHLPAPRPPTSQVPIDFPVPINNQPAWEKGTNGRGWGKGKINKQQQATCVHPPIDGVGKDRMKMWEYFLNIFDAHLPALRSRENIIFLLKIFDAHLPAPRPLTSRVPINNQPACGCGKRARMEEDRGNK